MREENEHEADGKREKWDEGKKRGKDEGDNEFQSDYDGVYLLHNIA